MGTRPGPRRKPGTLIGVHLPDGVVPAHDNYGSSPLLPRLGAGRFVVLADLLPGGAGAAYNGDYAPLSRPGVRRGEVVLVDLDLLPDGVAGASNGYYVWQPRPGAGRSEVFIGPLPDGGVGAVFAQQSTLQGAGRADGIAGALRGHSLGPGSGSGALADDFGSAVYDNSGVVAGHLRRLLGFVGIGACSVAVNGLAAAPGAPAFVFHLFELLLVGLFLVIMHVLRV